jgi:hypothetical protein
MTTYEACKSDMLIITVNESTGDIEAALNRFTRSATQAVDRRMRLVQSPGNALRLIHRLQPRLLLVSVEPAGLAQSTGVIDAIHRRRPQLPLIAIASIHCESVEREARAAGAGYYFALDNPADEELLGGTLRELDLAPCVTRSGLSPPTPRARPPARRRSRTGRSPFG